jgi:ubiquinone/menaquinone biosynthesis C-methylase UbiE
MGAATSAPTPHPAGTPAPDETVPAAAARPESSVRPEVNAEYLKPDLEVQAWIDRFERAGREIYDHRQAILRATGVARGNTVADVGAGTGLFTTLFAKVVGESGRVYAIDIAPAFLAHIDARIQAMGLTNVTTILGSERSVSLPEGSVDVVFLCDAYHHFQYPRSMNASLWKALRPGGTLILIDFKRVPGQSAQWVLDHVRAGQEVFTAELEDAGFRKLEELPLLKENYFIRFRKPAQAN